MLTGRCSHLSSRGVNSTRKLSSNRTNLEKRELPCQRDDLASLPPWSWVWTAQREQPLGLREQPQVQLRTAKRRLDAAGLRHLGNLLVIGPESDGVQGQGCGLVFDFERFFVDPHRHLFPGEAIFAKEAPVAEADVAMLVQVARKLRGIQDPREHLFRVGAS